MGSLIGVITSRGLIGFNLFVARFRCLVRRGVHSPYSVSSVGRKVTLLEIARLAVRVVLNVVKSAILPGSVLVGVLCVFGASRKGT